MYEYVMFWTLASLAAREVVLVFLLDASKGLK